jgi:hypothetical protein
MLTTLMVSMLMHTGLVGGSAYAHAPTATPVAPAAPKASSPPVDVLKTDFFAELQKVIEASQPEAGRQPGAVNGYDALMAAAVAAHGVNKASPDPSASDFEAIRSPESLDSLDPEARGRARAEALALMDELRKAGVDEHLAKAASAVRFVRPRLNSPERDAQVRRLGVEPEKTEPGERRVLAVPIPEIASFRVLLRYADARMVLAAEAERWDEFIQGFRGMMAMGSALTRHGAWRDRHAGAWTVSAGIQGVIGLDALARLPEDRLRELRETVDAFERDLPPFRTVLDGDRLRALDACRWVFGPDGRIDTRRLTELIRFVTGLDRDDLGEVTGKDASTRQETVVALEAIFGEAARRSELSAVQRRDLGSFRDWLKATAIPEQQLLGWLTPSLDLLLPSEDGLALRLLGLRTLIAIERYRRAHAGAEPANLEALVPAFMPTVPIDRFSDQPLRYVRLAAPDAWGRTFILYSVGADGVDDGGQPVPEDRGWRDDALRPGPRGAGLDFELNPAPDRVSAIVLPPRPIPKP